MDRNPIFRVGLLCCVSALLVTSCGPAHKTIGQGSAQKQEQATTAKKEEKKIDTVWLSICAANKVPKSLSTNFSLSFKATDLAIPESMRFSGQIRILKDSIQWLSAGMLGMEGYRTWLVGDSVYLLNRLKKECHIYTLSKTASANPVLAPFLGAGKTWLEAFLTGSLPDNIKKREVKRLLSADDSLLRYGWEDGELRGEIYARKSDLSLVRVLIPYNEKESLDISFTAAGGWTMKAALGSGTVSATCDYTKVKTNEEVVFPMSIPQNYKIYVH